MRLARRLLLRRVPVFAAVRQSLRYRSLEVIGLPVSEITEISSRNFPKHSVLVHTIPPNDDDKKIRDIVCEIAPDRVVYISSTSVYGELKSVNAESPAVPSETKGRRRLEEEEWIQSTFESSLIVRPAAIYGPGRGIHTRILQGTSPRSMASGVVSRIHVDDLAAVLEAGIYSDLEGAWPLADNFPCASEEICLWCADLLGVKCDPAISVQKTEGRAVDGQEIRSRLGVELIYPRYPEGILASLGNDLKPAEPDVTSERLPPLA